MINFSVAYHQGYQAFKDGYDALDDNPYAHYNEFRVYPKEWFQWLDGHYKAQNDWENVKSKLYDAKED